MQRHGLRCWIFVFPEELVFTSHTRSVESIGIYTMGNVVNVMGTPREREPWDSRLQAARCIRNGAL
jgi:hypothetical protein